MTQVLRAFSYGHGGLGVAMLALIAGWALPRAAVLGRPITAALLPWLWGIVCASMLAEFVLTGWYLFSPAYLDHVEASVISSVHTLIAGAPLYPSPDSYTLSGLLYGPLLAEADSLGYVLFHDAFSVKIVGWLAGWTSVVVLVVQMRHNARGAGSLAALTYALSYLLSFGADVTVARPEPLLLLFTASSLAIALNVEGPLGSILLGLLCGAAVGLKVHAPVYLLPSIYLWVVRQTAQPRHRGWTSLAVCFCVAAVAGVALPFVPHNVSAAGYLRFLTLAAKHGLSLDLLGRNCAFVAGIWAPVLLLGGSCSRTTEAGEVSRSRCWARSVSSRSLPRNRVRAFIISCPSWRPTPSCSSSCMYRPRRLRPGVQFWLQQQPFLAWSLQPHKPTAICSLSIYSCRNRPDNATSYSGSRCGSLPGFSAWLTTSPTIWQISGRG
jgi:hypothetical protein